ncbi:uncharacterized protein PITG_12294 [Phytophthora infestans T30-4]|uniref:Uncharacterized protein n=2 Tax=Phytophthora infestans TaxID=4787 RepID=D0NJI6_PHYIT|nr:uncharacterized protein PITG_12294 [Phytophthora infestans T30-4]EEY59704.1 conserved hypothetical protein [Phytophthora infestans T30-4]KAF4041274.1 hypothetical protein GN244_ATG06449 [Phytophthora infestans]KAF4149678.1 hypothetical protein GN958_ATG01074 [Phytophthora infestans]KAI9999157.1 hypothetical protein PInf_003975 [Phytophthora infestans]|eukprot:XP_002900897.1 conserved hypothetical protein [Phytophthora infestans T30-4]
MNSSGLPPPVPGKLCSNDVEPKSSRVRLPSLPVLEDDADNFIYEDDGESNDEDGNSELCRYIQRLEKEKQELENEVHVLKDQNASQRLKSQTAERRIEMLEASLKDAINTGDAFRQEKDVVLAVQASERERMASMVALLEEAQNRYEDAERARQSATFKLSSLQATRADATSQSLLPPVPKTIPTPRSLSSNVLLEGSVDFDERIEKYKRDIELLRQKLELTEEQAAERQKLAVSLALHEAQLDSSNVVEHMKLECERRINEWRHCEAVRAKEKESALDEDRYSIRLEMRYALQRSQIDQRVALLQAETEFKTDRPSPREPIESDFSIGTLDEVLVRMQLEQVRTRRFEALKKALLIRHAQLNQAAKELFCRWKLQASNMRIMRLNAVLHMYRIALHFESRKKLRSFNQWRDQTRQLQAQNFQAQALSCWNRMIAVERISHVIRQTTVCYVRHVNMR